MSRLSSIAISFIRGFLPSDLEEREYRKFLKLQELGVFESGENGVMRVRSLFRVGRLSIAESGRGYVTLENREQRELLIEPHHLADAENGDEVVVRRVIAKRGRASAKVVMVLNYANINRVVYLKKGESSFEIIDIRTSLPTKIESIEGGFHRFEDGTLFLVNARDGKILEILGNIRDAKVDEKISLLLYDRADERFSEDCVEEANSISKSVQSSEAENRVDLRDLPFCTIDPTTAKDFDDAIFWDGDSRRLYVAIADVSYYIKHFSAIDREARARGFTTYLPHKAFPMLPRELSENICSLKPNLDRLAFVCRVEFDRDLNPVKEEFFEAIIHSVRRFNYDEIDKILGGVEETEAEDREIVDRLIALYKVTRRLKTKRLKRGFDFRSGDVKVEIDRDHLLKSSRVEIGTPAHSLVEECMLVANRASAKIFRSEDGIFRVHDEPSESSIENLIEELGSVGIFIETSNDATAKEIINSIKREAEKVGAVLEVDELIIKSLTKASYSHKNRGHFGLGFKYYSHFTSPIRRYSDLILHRLIKAKLKEDKEELDYLRRNLEPISVLISKLERDATKAEWDFRDRKFARWAESQVGKSFKAKIIEIDSESAEKGAKARVECQFDGLVVNLRVPKSKLFDEVEIEISDVDIFKPTILAKEI
jgi:ribonuclease R